MSLLNNPDKAAEEEEEREEDKTQEEQPEVDRKSVVQGKSVDLGGRRIIKKKT